MHLFSDYFPPSNIIKKNNKTKHIKNKINANISAVDCILHSYSRLRFASSYFESSHIFHLKLTVNKGWHISTNTLQ